MASQLIFNGLPGLQQWSEDFSDVAIYCGPAEFKFKLHSVILSAHSEYFAKALSGQFAESKSREIRLPEIDKETFARLVQFCYSGTYTESLPLENSNENKRNQKSARYCFSATYSKHSADLKEMNRWGGFGALYLSPPEIANNHLYFSGLLGAAGCPMPQAKTEPSNVSGQETDEKSIPSDPFNSTWQSIVLAGKVYLTAEVLLVPGAKVLAVERMRTGVDDLVATSDVPAIGNEFAELIEDIYTKLPDTDVAIKEPICYFFAMKRLDRLVWDFVKRLMLRHGALAAGVVHYINLLAPTNLVKGNMLCPGHRSEHTVQFQKHIMARINERMRLEWMHEVRRTVPA